MVDAEITDKDMQAADEIGSKFAKAAKDYILAESQEDARRGWDAVIADVRQAITNAREEERREGLERAAKWHDERFAWGRKQISIEPKSRSHWDKFMRVHNTARKAIRALKETK